MDTLPGIGHEMGMIHPTLAVAVALLLGVPSATEPPQTATPTAASTGSTASTATPTDPSSTTAPRPALLPESPSPPPLPPPLPPPPPAPVPWGADERMEFVIDYLGITIGRARISVGPADGGAAPLQLSSRSAGLMSVVTFKQTLVSQLDVVTLLPRASALEATEPGGYKHTDTARFDRATNKATVRERGRFDKSYEIEVPEGTVDFLALVFRLRTLPLADGASHAFQVLSGRKVSQVVAVVVKRESVRTDAGRFAAVKVRVPTGFDGKFSEKNPTYVWFSDDPRHVVVKISTDFAVGRAEAELTSYQPGRVAVEPTVVPAPASAEPPPPPPQDPR
jgi:hypothetical protein